jgi:4'-phosphopantetheinyl transferase
LTEVTPEIQLPEGEVHAWVEPLTWTDALLAEAREALSFDENQRADRFLQDLHRNRYLISHLKLRRILAQYLGTLPRELQFETSQFGKPIFPVSENPGINFNLSHSNDRMILGVVRKAAIGVDIEEIRPEVARLDVAARFFTQQENEDLRSLVGDEQIRAFFTCWTRKEAYLKAVGLGLCAHPTDCEVTLKPGDKPAITRQLPSEEVQTWSVFHYAHANYVSAIAVNLSTLTLKQKSG